MEKRLHLSATNKKVGGVCGGLGEYFGVDATLIRVIWVLAMVVTAFLPGILAYLLAWAIIPSVPRQGG